MRYWHKHNQIDQWNQMKSPEPADTHVGNICFVTLDPQGSGGKTVLSIHCEGSSIWGKTNLSPGLPLFNTAQGQGTLLLYACMMMAVMVATSPLYITILPLLKVLSNLLFSPNPKKQAGKTLLVLSWMMRRWLQGTSDQPKDTCLALELCLWLLPLCEKPSAPSWGAWRGAGRSGLWWRWTGNG